MKQKSEHRVLYLRTTMISYFLVLCLQWIFSTSFVESVSLNQVVEEVPHVLLPAKFTFYLWIIILLWEALAVFIGQVRQGFERYNQSYQLLAAPKLVELYFYHAIYLLLWSQKLYLFTFVLMMLYLRQIISFMKLISYKSSLNEPNWLLKLPIGLHTGWLISMTVYIFYSYLVSKGLNSHNGWMLSLACLLLFAIATVSAYLYARYGNQAIMPAVLIFQLGLLYHHYPSSSFVLRHNFFYLVIAVLFILTLAVYIRYLRYQINQKSFNSFNIGGKL
ncbi:hypothetical protein [Facklamia sp. 7083-14-GEN3]|uniref:hypothetical protein n=1 Tax=Facklamia sp. 7083-14-GEN3 TaxID=2973478 RepID=UPI00215BA82E|nr:hypothetical protein [Facklamia sp. 7083-14-GEN3]MCR8969826.1 hypothetical protein [Facklamia sp. 7083-14-GEN3]